ncbi:MAG: hypothetical protein UZ14_CFX002002696 [Chloroflexi bacterium OLB14]|nr:MAG: hypothetical protein UZ14_CFX002002696 [Chloroflexi bacterium OLB14]
MSMEDILKVLVDSRQAGNQQQQASDPMTDLIGNLLGGGQPSTSSQQPANPIGDLIGSLLGSGQPQTSQPPSELGNMMGILETIMNPNKSNPAANSPIMMLLQPFVVQLAKKMKISPEIAMLVVSFVAYKLLAHHPTSGRDSNSFDLDDMLNQMNTGKIDQNILQNSGMVNELARSTGLDQATAAKSLETAFSMFGKQIQTGMSPSGTTNTRRVSVSRNRLNTTRVKGGASKSRK